MKKLSIIVAIVLFAVAVVRFAISVIAGAIMMVKGASSRDSKVVELDKVLARQTLSVRELFSNYLVWVQTKRQAHAQSVVDADAATKAEAEVS